MPKIVIEPSGGEPRVVTDKAYDLESVLQQNLASLPDLIPIDEAAGEPIEFLPIGVEVVVGTGAVDVLLISSDAVLTIVETKLARNPESRREVVGQVLEYAAYVSEWGLEEVRRTADKHLGGGFDQALRDFLGIEETDTSGLDDFLNRLDQNQKAGKLRLIVATDRLVETALKTITFVNANSNFEIYLLQITRYEDADGTRIYIFPRSTGTRGEFSRRRREFLGPGRGISQSWGGQQMTSTGQRLFLAALNEQSVDLISSSDYTIDGLGSAIVATSV